MKLKDEEWKGPKAPRKESDPTMPHEWARKMSEQAPAVKREKSTKIGNVAVDIYVAPLGAEGGGLPFLPSLVDWTKAKNAVLFYVGREDLYHRVEQRYDFDGKEGRSGSITMDFSAFHTAKNQLPDEVKKKLGIE